MRITSITAKAGRTINHPHEDYANLRCDIELDAALDAGDDPIESAKELQRLAETLVEDHKRNLLESLEVAERMREAEQKILRLGGLIQQQQMQLDAARETLDATQQQTLLDQSFTAAVAGDIDER